jgi:hypothetical protein
MMEVVVLNEVVGESRYRCRIVDVSSRRFGLVVFQLLSSRNCHLAKKSQGDIRQSNKSRSLRLRYPARPDPNPEAEFRVSNKRVFSA